MTDILFVLRIFTKDMMANGKNVKDFELLNYIDIGTNEHNFEVLENPEKVAVSCINCGFTADTVAAFAIQTAKGYYWPKVKCQKAPFKR